MIKLNRKIEYALMVLKWMVLHSKGQLITAKEVSADTNIPFDAASRVMQQMAQAKVLKSEQGVRGGYSLEGDLNQVPFLKIVEAVSGKVEVVRCITSGSDCDLFEKCNVASPLKIFNQKIETFYASLMVAELLMVPPNVTTQSQSILSELRPKKNLKIENQNDFEKMSGGNI